MGTDQAPTVCNARHTKTLGSWSHGLRRVKSTCRPHHRTRGRAQGVCCPRGKDVTDLDTASDVIGTCVSHAT